MILKIYLFFTEYLINKCLQIKVRIINGWNISIFFLCDNFVEFFECEELIGLCMVEDVSVVHHFRDFLVIHCFSEFASYVLDLLKVNKAFIVGVIQGKQFFQSFLRFRVSQSVAYDIQELLEVDWSVFGLEVADHQVNNMVSLVQSQLLQYLLDL